MNDYSSGDPSNNAKVAKIPALCDKHVCFKDVEGWSQLMKTSLLVYAPSIGPSQYHAQHNQRGKVQLSSFGQQVDQSS